MVSFFLGVPDPNLGMMRLVIIVSLVYGIIFGFLNSLHPLLPPPTKPTKPPTTYLSLTRDYN